MSFEMFKKHSNESENNNKSDVQNYEPKIVESKYGIPLFQCENNSKYLLKYHYVEKLCFCSNINDVNVDDEVYFTPNETNPYDKNTMEAFVKGIKIGLLYKGNCRDILWKCYKYQKFEFISVVNKIDYENNLIWIEVGFFAPIENYTTIKTSVVKINKNDYYGYPRADNIIGIDVGDMVHFLYDENLDSVVVYCSNFEIGELSTSIKNKIMEQVTNIDTLIGEVCEFDYDENCNPKLKIIIYI